MNSQSIIIGAVVFLIVGAIATIIGVVVDSTSSVGDQEYGLLLNKYTGVVNYDKVYENGRYWPGPGHKFIIFSAVSIDTSDLSSISLRSADGVDVTVQVSLQYSVEKENVVTLFKAFGSTFENHLKNIAVHSVREGASEFNATAFFQERTATTQYLSNLTATAFEDVGATLEGLQIENPSLPPRFQFFINQATARQEAIREAENRRERRRTEADTRENRERNNAERRVVEEEGRIEGQLTGELQTIDGRLVELLAQKDAFRLFTEGLNLTSEQLLTFLWVESVGESSNRKMIVVDSSQS
eukprot:gb/GECH01007060.1/.p1 GENE.gb/GECH01007060.1/~~gb/GECH01007060.1/.p1  ORF type:complete len:299 (+),score=85.97 gb/GECH01007060.1/:1-897(+)